MDPPSAASRSRMRSRSSMPTATNRDPTSTDTVPSSFAQTVRSPVPASSSPTSVVRGDAGERERGHADAGHDAAAQEAPHAPSLAAHRLHAGEDVEVRLREAQVADRADDLPVLDEERPVARHARDDDLLLVDGVRVPEPGHEQATVHAAD